MRVKELGKAAALSTPTLPRRRVDAIEEYLENQYDAYDGFIDCEEIHPRDGMDRMDEEEHEPLHVEEV